MNWDSAHQRGNPQADLAEHRGCPPAALARESTAGAAHRPGNRSTHCTLLSAAQRMHADAACDSSRPGSVHRARLRGGRRVQGQGFWGAGQAPVRPAAARVTRAGSTDDSEKAVRDAAVATVVVAYASMRWSNLPGAAAGFTAAVRAGSSTGAQHPR